MVIPRRATEPSFQPRKCRLHRVAGDRSAVAVELAWVVVARKRRLHV
jgi:hypothetical protein